MSGTLYLVATPIGNLSDLSPRVKSIFEKVDLILAEDTRVTIKLLNHLSIKKRMLSCHDFNEKSRLKIISEFNNLNQSIALVSDAGTPLISDPGYEIVRQAITQNMDIIPIPGPSAGLLALTASGLPCDRFVFEGFLPIKQSLLQEKLDQLRLDDRTIIFYESPHRLLKTLDALKESFGDRDICIAKELTKIHEEFMRGKISEVLIQLSKKTILGEYVIVVAGNNDISSSVPDTKDIELLIKNMLEQGLTVKTIVQNITNTYKVKHSDIYQLALKSQKIYSQKGAQD